MKKLPAIQFYTGDHTKDPNLSMCSPATRGIWIDLICAMHELNRSGQITGTAQQFARVCRCTAVEAEAALAELEQTKAANITKRGDVYTVINRRMKREFDDREGAKQRMQKMRKTETVTERDRNVTERQNISNKEVKPQNANCYADVTPYSSFSSSNSTTNGSGSSSNSANGKPPPSAAEINSPKNGQWIELDLAEKLMSKKEFVEHLQRLYPTKNVREIGKKLKEFCDRHGKTFALERLKGWTVGEVETFTDAEFLAAFGEDKPSVPAWQKAINDCRLCDEKGLTGSGGRLTPCDHKQVEK